MPIDPNRLALDIDTLAAFSEVPLHIGHSRPTFSPPWLAARDYLIAEAQKLNCTIRLDSAGNTHIRPAHFPPTQPLWLSGSHFDSVPTGGKFDGVVGCVVPLEVLRAYPHAPLELILFAEEEGTTFNLGMLGSRAWAGTLLPAQLAALKNKQGQSFPEAGAPAGVDLDKLASDKLLPSRYRGFIEVHVEQGLSMWNQNIPVALVTAINGRRQYLVELTGQPNHAGSTKMADRKDALAAAGDILVALEHLAKKLDRQLDHSVITVGRLEIAPNAINVIAGRVNFHIDFRARTDEMLLHGDALIKQTIEEITDRRHITFTLHQTEFLRAAPMAKSVCDQLRLGATRAGVLHFPEVASGALHDAAILAPLMPTAMLFIASKSGISHNPAEFSRIEDIALAAQILAEAVTA